MTALTNLREKERLFEENEERRREILSSAYDDDDEDEFFDQLLNAIKRYKDSYTFKVEKVEYAFIYRYAANIFGVIDKPKVEKKIAKTELRAPILYLLDELGVDRAYSKYICCHKGEMKTYTIHCKNLTIKQARALYTVL